MRSSHWRIWLSPLLMLQLGSAAPEPYRLAEPGYRYSFPRDHFNHPDFRTEWWYYTGNLRTSEGRRFGFELTFFRQGVDRRPSAPQVWEIRDVWLAHLALSDIDGGRFFHTERLNRSGPGIAGADREQARIWNGNWQAQWTLNPQAPGAMAAQHLQAIAENFSFDLVARTRKPPVVHGENGISQKAEGEGHASHYISFTRLLTSGTIVIDGQRYTVEGESWMDHEFFTHQLAADLSGWDWFSLQWKNGSEIMLFRLRRKDGTADPYSAGTYIDPQGHATHLTVKDFSVTPGTGVGTTWTSPISGGRYPIAWTIRVPSLGLDAALTTRLPQQEIAEKTDEAKTDAGKANAGLAYWEGAIEVKGIEKGQPVEGRGYLEMTGYAGSAPLTE